MTAGKLLKDFSDHQGPVTTMDFHPNEYFFCTGSNDRTVKLFDVESFQRAGSSDFESSSIRAVGFHPDGSKVINATQDALKVFSMDPFAVTDVIDVPWKGLMDMRIWSGDEKLLGVAADGPTVQVWVTC